MIIGTNGRRMNRLGHRGIDGTGCHRIDANAERRKLDGELLGEMRETRLAGAVGGSQRRGAKSRDRRDVDDCTTPMFAHQRCRSLRAYKRPAEIDGEHAIPVVLRCLQQWLEDRYAGIVDEGIEPAESLAHFRNGISNGSRVRYVAFERKGCVRFRQRRHGCAQRLNLNIEQRDTPAIREKALCGRKADATCGTCYKRHLFVFVSHARSAPSHYRHELAGNAAS